MKNVGRVKTLVLCIMSGDTLYLYKVPSRFQS